MQRSYRIGNRHVAVSLQRAPSGTWRVQVGGTHYEVEAALVAPHVLQVSIGGRQHIAYVARRGPITHVAIGGTTYDLLPESPSASSDHPPLLAPPQITAPMPGKVLQVFVSAGAHVAAGEGLLILEAMKMEHRIIAEAAARVAAVYVADGQMVDGGTVLLELEYASATA
jgi:biotin carboxyl carrier protein